MTEKEKLNRLEECMELDEGTLKPEDRLDSYEEWDSISALALIAFLDEKFHKTVDGAELKKLQTVKDAILLME